MQSPVAMRLVLRAGFPALGETLPQRQSLCQVFSKELPHSLDTILDFCYRAHMVIKPLDKRAVAARPRLQRVLGWYEAGIRVEDIARMESSTARMVYYWLGWARKLRSQGRL